MSMKKKRASRVDTTHRPLYAIYEEQRKYPRVVLEVPVEVRSQSANAIMTLAYDISPDGLQIRCDRTTAFMLNPSGQFKQEDFDVNFEFLMHLPTTHGSEAFTAIGNILYIAMGTDKQIVFGIKFGALDDRALQVLDCFLESALVPWMPPAQSAIVK